MSLTIVCQDESSCVIQNTRPERLGVVLEGLFDTCPEPRISLAHLFNECESVEPLKMFIEGCDKPLLNMVVSDVNGRLAKCYEAALGELNMPAFVDMVDDEVYRMVADRVEINSPALMSMPTIAAIRKTVLRAFPDKKLYLTRRRIVDSIADNDMFIMLTDDDKYVCILNFRRCMMRTKFFEWMTSNQKYENLRTDDAKIRKDMLNLNYEKKKYIVFEGDAYTYIYGLTHGHLKQGLWDERETFNTLLRAQNGDLYKPTFSKTICTDHLDDYGDHVNAATSYTKHGRGKPKNLQKDICGVRWRFQSTFTMAFQMWRVWRRTKMTQFTAGA